MSCQKVDSRIRRKGRGRVCCPDPRLWTREPKGTISAALPCLRRAQKKGHYSGQFYQGGSNHPRVVWVTAACHTRVTGDTCDSGHSGSASDTRRIAPAEGRVSSPSPVTPPLGERVL